MDENFQDIHKPNENKKKTSNSVRNKKTRHRVQPVVQSFVEPESPASLSNDEESQLSQEPFEHNVIYQSSSKRKQGNSPQRMNEQINHEIRNISPLTPSNAAQLKRQKAVNKDNTNDEMGSHGVNMEKQFSIDVSVPNNRESLHSNPQIQELIQMLKKEGMVTDSPKRSGQALLKNAHESIKKRREIVQALNTPWLDHLCEQLCWYTQYIFSISTIILLIFYASYDHPAPFVNTFLVQAIASIAYFVKASHVGEMKIGETPIPFVRYVDWITTTPLMLYELCHIAHAQSHAIVMVIGCDLITLSLGISSAIIDQEHYFGVKYTLFTIAAAFYILMVCTLVMDVAHPLYEHVNHEDDDYYVAQDDNSKSNISHTIKLFDNLETLMIVSWSFYPIAVLLGRAHFGIITQSLEDGFICLLDIISKIGMEGMIIVYAIEHYKASSDDGH